MRRVILPLALALVACSSAPAAAAPEPPRDLEVVEGGGWRADTWFELRWTNPRPFGPGAAAVHYAVRDAAGAAVVGPTRIGSPAQSTSFRVPAVPGTYSAEVWLEDAAGFQGQPATVPVRFDDTRPGGAQPLSVPGWIGRARLPLRIQIAHPAGPEPPAGVRGYAVSSDRDPDGSPCAAQDRCADAETDLRAGAGGDTIAVGLPEGISYVHAVAVSGSGMRSRNVGSVAVRVDATDPVTALAGARPEWSDRPVTLRAFAVDDASGMAPAGPTGPFTAIQVDGGAPIIAEGESATATVIGNGAHLVRFYARDAAGNVGGRAPAVAVVRIDRERPQVHFLPSAHADDPELLEATVVDGLSGPEPARGWIGVRRLGSSAPFDPLPTEVREGTLRAHWRSDSYPSGRYEFRAVGFDRAGNRAVGDRRVNGSRMVLPSPLKSPVRVDGWIVVAGRRLRSRTVAFAEAAVYGGRLSLPSGEPLAGLTVEVVEDFDPGARRKRSSTTTRTGSDGRFAVRLAPGPSRSVRTVFAGTATRSWAVSESTRLEVRPRLRLRVSSHTARIGGRPVIFSGSIEAGPPAAADTPVQLQFHLPGLPWTEFRTIRSGSGGRFRYAYRFSDDDSRGVRFLFRAVVAPQPGWPFAEAASLPVYIRGA